MLVGCLAALGIILSFFAHTCAESQTHGIKLAKFFGKVPWSIIGPIGYVLIIAANGIAWVNPVVTQVLTGTGAFVTLWLMYVAYRVKLLCPYCMVIWLLNMLIAGAAFFHAP